MSTLDFSWQRGIQKIVVYATKYANGAIKEITHGALQDTSNGTVDSCSYTGTSAGWVTC